MNGREYLESMKDGREVWYDGERVASVVDHPVLGRCAQNRAREYDLHGDPEYHELFTRTDESGRSHCVMYHIPTGSEDLVRYRRAMEIAVDRAGGGVSDHTHFSQEGATGSLLRLRSLLGGKLRSKIGRAHV